MLVNTFFDDALWSMIITFLSPRECVIFAEVCKATQARTVAEWQTWWFKAHDECLKSSLRNTIAAVLLPTAGTDWTWQRLSLWRELSLDPSLKSSLDHASEWTIEFWVASDQINTSTCRSAAQVDKLDAIAATLRRHPRLRLRVDGHAAKDAPTIYGGPISQARATRVRSELLRRLGDHPAWSDELESQGRAPAHMDDKDIEDTYLEYQPKRVGSKLEAVGVWRRDPAYFASQPECGGQSAEVRIVGIDGYGSVDGIQEAVASTRLEGVES